MVSGDIKRAVEIIDQRINSLQQIRRMLLDEFGMNDRSPDSTLMPTTGAPTGTETRKQAIAKLLKVDGPLSRRDIVARTGFPLGTIAYVLNDKEIFKRRKGGKWSVVSESTM